MFPLIDTNNPNVIRLRTSLAQHPDAPLLHKETLSERHRRILMHLMTGVKKLDDLFTFVTGYSRKADVSKKLIANASLLNEIDALRLAGMVDLLLVSKPRDAFGRENHYEAQLTFTGWVIAMELSNEAAQEEA